MGTMLPYLSLGISLLAIALSYWGLRVAQRRSVRPVLVFSHEGRDPGEESVWHVENAGLGPAINVLLAAGNTDCVWDSRSAVQLPALSVKGKRRLTWIHHPGSLVATYTDADGRAYTTIWFVMPIDLWPRTSIQN